jgi:hypothetical protein
LSFTDKLAAMAVIPAKYKNTCLMCNDSLKEDTQHLLILCNGYKQERERFLDTTQIKNLLKTKILDDQILMSIILGCDNKEHFKIFENLHGDLLKLINLIIKKRAMKIQKIKTNEA